MSFEGAERRKVPRVRGKFMLSYSLCDRACDPHIDISQARNIGSGGMLIVTNRQFEPGARLSIKVCLPFLDQPMVFTVQVLESIEVVRSLVYDTRVMFVGLSKGNSTALQKTVEYYLRQDGEHGKKS